MKNNRFMVEQEDQPMHFLSPLSLFLNTLICGGRRSINHKVELEILVFQES
jgi:hypothetical protein